MTPIVVTNSSPSGRIKRVPAAAGGGGGSFTPNLPSGLTLSADVEFDATWSAPAPNAFYTYKGASFAIYNAETVGTGLGEQGQRAMRAIWEVNRTDGYGGAMYPIEADGQTSRTVYWAFTMKLNPGFVHEVSAGTKIVYPPTYRDGANATRPALNVQAVPKNNASATEYTWQFQQMWEWDGSSISYIIDGGHNMAPSYVMSVGTWYRHEVLMRLDTPGIAPSAADGVCRVWTSAWTGSAWATPTLLIEHTNLVYTGTIATTDKYIYAPTLDLYRGGSGTPTVNSRTILDFSRTYWARSTARI
jgi:hypothetical protein